MSSIVFGFGEATGTVATNETEYDLVTEVF
jgi:hypothetical protein